MNALEGWVRAVELGRWGGEGLVDVLLREEGRGCGFAGMGS